MFKKVLHNIITLPLGIIAGLSAGLATAIVVIDKPISAAFGLEEEYNNGLDEIIEVFEETKEDLKFD
jgi:hypothetical protein